jgi:hypothetical protein
MPTIVTPRPPLNLFEALRLNATDQWTNIYTVPKYRVPASGPVPQRDINAAAIMNGMIITNTTNGLIDVSVRIIGTNAAAYPVVVDAQVPTNDFMIISLERQVMLTDEAIQVKVGAGQAATVHFTFILNTREEYEVIT